MARDRSRREEAQLAKEQTGDSGMEDKAEAAAQAVTEAAAGTKQHQEEKVDTEQLQKEWREQEEVTTTGAAETAKEANPEPKPVSELADLEADLDQLLADGQDYEEKDEADNEPEEVRASGDESEPEDPGLADDDELAKEQTRDSDSDDDDDPFAMMAELLGAEDSNAAEDVSEDEEEDEVRHLLPYTRSPSWLGTPP